MTAFLDAEWRPIEMAPKDGTLILARGVSPFHDGPPHTLVVSWRTEKAGDGFVIWDGFVIHDPFNMSSEWHQFNPTHWMPLPLTQTRKADLSR